ncbi:protein lifeguard 3 isoform X3 [Halyomorpha halys]|uniref:protein lifeguard 3 isoform X3 n=1 Tax=Halyomorpha halys TaxID=286706 RepID=UPI0034D26091
MDSSKFYGLERIMRKRVSALEEQMTLDKEQMRREFVFKTFGLLSCQLFYFLLNLLLFFCLDSFKFYLAENMTLVYLCFVLSQRDSWHNIYTTGFIQFFKKTSLAQFLFNKFHGKECLLITSMVFFLALGMSAYACVNRLPILVFIIGILFSVVIFVTVLARFGPCDVAGCSMICCVLGVVFCIYGVVASFIILLTGFKLMQLGYAGVAVILLSLYLMFDTQVMLENKKLKIHSNAFVRGNIHLYVDVILIFFRLIRIGFKFVKSKLKCRRKTKKKDVEHETKKNVKYETNLKGGKFEEMKNVNHETKIKHGKHETKMKHGKHETKMKHGKHETVVK